MGASLPLHHILTLLDYRQMSLSLEVFFPLDRMPALKTWQDSIQSNGFSMELHQDMDPLTFSGYWPASYQNRPSGFEYCHSVETDETMTKTLRISFVWGGDADEAICAAIAAGCLANLTGGHLVDTNSGEHFLAADCINWARDFENALWPMSADVQPNSTMSMKPAAKAWWKFW